MGGELYFSNPANETGRNHMTLKKSEDSGARWKTVSLLDEGPSGYSTLVKMTDKSVGVIYENGKKSTTEKLTLAVVDTST